MQLMFCSYKTMTLPPKFVHLCQWRGFMFSLLTLTLTKVHCNPMIMCLLYLHMIKICYVRKYNEPIKTNLYMFVVYIVLTISLPFPF